MILATTCINANGDDIGAMVDQARPISYSTARRRIGVDALRAAFPQYEWRHGGNGLRLRNDYHVEYARSRYRGRRCYYVRWSAIEFVFV